MAAYFDSHAHLTSDEVFDNIEEMLGRAKTAGVAHIVNICTDAKTLERGLALSKKYPWIYQAGSTTPHDVEKEGETLFETFAKCARNGELHAIGETGLDYYYEHSGRGIQKTFLRKYLHLALECDLPVIIHCREAFGDFFEILDAEYRLDDRHAPGVVHCFTGTMSEAEEVIKRGWMLSLSGIVTFKKSTSLQEVAKMVPLQNLLIETDTPYLAPQKHRGEVNEPAYVADTAAFIAELKNISVQELAEASTQNAFRLFLNP